MFSRLSCVCFRSSVQELKQLRISCFSRWMDTHCVLQVSIVSPLLMLPLFFYAVPLSNYAHYGVYVVFWNL